MIQLVECQGWGCWRVVFIPTSTRKWNTPVRLQYSIFKIKFNMDVNEFIREDRFVNNRK